MSVEKMMDNNEVLEAVRTINHHVKDLVKLEKYLEYCEIAEEHNCRFTYDDLEKEPAEELEELLSNRCSLDWVSQEHYGIRLNASQNEHFSKKIVKRTGESNAGSSASEGVDIVEELLKMEEELEKGKDNMYSDIICMDWNDPDEELVLVDEFLLPEIKSITAFKKLVKCDIDLLYALKDIFIETYLLDSLSSEFDVRLTERQKDEYGNKYICITANVGFKYHYPSEQIYDARTDLPETEFKGGSGEHGFWGIKKDDVVDAILIIRSFLKGRRGEK